MSFWCALGTPGATLGAIGHYLGNLVDPRVKIRSSCWSQVQLKLQFGIHLGVIFPTKVVYFLGKVASQNKPTIKSNLCSIFVPFQWPLDLDFWALACTGAQLSKNYLDSWKLQKSSPKWSKIGAQRLQNSVRRLKNCIWKSIPKKASKTRAQQWAHTLIGTPPPHPWVVWGECPSGGHFGKDSLHMGCGGQPICSSFGLKAAVSRFSHSLCL